MRTYEVHFTISGRAFRETVTAANISQARTLLITRYPGARITSIREIG